ncbi:hypothetical protein Tco_0659919 [Tanacetum coccineum]
MCNTSSLDDGSILLLHLSWKQSFMIKRSKNFREDMWAVLGRKNKCKSFRNGDCGTGSQSDNTVGSPHGFIIHWVVIFKYIKKVTEIFDVKNGVRSGSDNGSTSSELEARVCIQGEMLDGLENLFGKKCLTAESVVIQIIQIMYLEDAHGLRFLETEFPSIVYEDALTSEPEVSTEPTNLYVPFGIPFDPTMFYKDGACTSVAEAKDFEDRLARIYDRQVHRVHVLDFDVLLEEMDQAMTDRLRMEHTGADGQVMFADSVLDLDTADTFQEPLRRLCHRLIAFSIAKRGHAPEKVTNTDLFYLRSLDEGAIMNVPYLLAYYLFRHASGRKQGSRMSGGHFIARLGLVRLRIYDRLGDVVTWVAMGLERQQVRATAGATHVDPKVAQEGVQADPTLVEVAQMPQATASAPGRVGDRLQRLEEEVHKLGEIVVQQGVLIDRLSTDQSRFATWMIGRMTQLMDASSLRYQGFDGSFVGISHVPYQRCGVRQRTENPITYAAAPQTQPEPGP